MPYTGGRKPGVTTMKTRQKERAIDADDLNPPKPHKKGDEWTEEQAIAEMEYLIRFLSCDDPKKLFFGQCMRTLGYKSPNHYSTLAKKFGGQVAELYSFANLIQQEKVAVEALNKNFDSRFGVFAMSNISGWRQNQTIDTTSTIQIKTKDYKGIQPVISERMERGKKGK